MIAMVLKPGTARVFLVAGLLTATSSLIGCNSTSEHTTKKAPDAEISSVSKFSVADYGVDASPRVTTSKKVKKGGGRAMVGRPYKVRGKWYTPKDDPNYSKSGLASWYGPNFHGRLTANGEIYDQYHLSAAHKTFPLPSYARVTNKKNGHSVIVRVNDRGPFAHGRIIDLSSKAADLLVMKNDGIAAVQVEYVGRAPTEGDDTPYLMASYQGPAGIPSLQDQSGATGVMLAMNGPTPSTGLSGNGALPALGNQQGRAKPRALVPPGMVAQAGSSRSETVESALLPVGFSLPEYGPVLEIRPNTKNIAPLAMSLPQGYRDIGMAYRGNRVTISRNPFDLILTGARR